MNTVTLITTSAVLAGLSLLAGCGGTSDPLSESSAEVAVAVPDDAGPSGPVGCEDVRTGESVPCPITPPMPKPPPPPPTCNDYPGTPGDPGTPVATIPAPAHLPPLAMYESGCKDPVMRCSKGSGNPYFYNPTDDVYVGQLKGNSLVLYKAVGSTTSFPSAPFGLLPASSPYANKAAGSVKVGDKVLYLPFQVDVRAYSNGCSSNRC